MSKKQTLNAFAAAVESQWVGLIPEAKEAASEVAQYARKMAELTMMEPIDAKTMKAARDAVIQFVARKGIQTADKAEAKFGQTLLALFDLAVRLLV